MPAYNIRPVFGFGVVLILNILFYPLILPKLKRLIEEGRACCVKLGDPVAASEDGKSEESDKMVQISNQSVHNSDHYNNTLASKQNIKALSLSSKKALKS